jgi:hypothetical protein
MPNHGLTNLYFDVDHDGGTAPQTDDFLLHSSAALYEKYGTGSGWPAGQTAADGWTATIGFNDVAEFSISYTKLDITVDHAKTLGYGVYLMSTPSALWPSGLDDEIPDTWANMTSTDHWGQGVPNQAPELLSGTALPLEATEDEEITFRVMYRDLDGDGPDSIGVELQNGTEAPFGMDLTQEAGSEPWNVGRFFSVRTKLAPGSYKFRFNASDGMDWAIGEVDWNPNVVLVNPRNKLPELSQAAFTPPEGDTNTEFRFEVYYRDADGEPATTAQIFIDDAPFDMLSDSTGPWVDWTLFYYDTTLAVGDDHKFYFVFSDGVDDVRLPLVGDSPNWFTGPVVVPPNTPPVLASEVVAPAQGDRGSMFKFSCVYMDVEGDHPVESMVYIDGEGFAMAPETTDYVAGARFSYSTNLSLGYHAFYFVFNDSKAQVRHPMVGSFTGPEVLNLGPLAAIASPADGTRYSPDEMIPLSAVGTADPDGDAVTFQWSSDRDGDLGTDEAFEVQLSEGWHVITLTVTDPFGAKDTANVDVEVRPYLPHLFIESLTYDVAPMIEGDELHFTSWVGNDGEADSPGTVVVILVDGVEVYNDTASIDVDANASVEYTWTAVVGSHTIRIEAGEASKELSISIAANTPPSADPLVSDDQNLTEFKVDETLSFLAQASDADGDALTFEWDFGDGTARVTTRDPTHAFAEAGTYTVTLNVTDARGTTTTKYLEVVVKKPKTEESPGLGAAMAACALVVALVAISRRR